MIFARWISPAILLAVVSTCTDQNGSGASPELVFQVNEALLDSCHSDSLLGVQICPPLGWKSAPAQVMSAIRERMKQTPAAEPLQFTVRRAFVENGSGNACLLTRLTAPDSLAELPKLGRIYGANLREHFSGAEIREGTFRIQDIDVVQFLILMENKIIFKLLFPTPGKAFGQLDYSLSRATYADQIKMIESSIGSLRWTR